MVGGARSVVCVCACGMTVVLCLRWEATLIPTALCASSRAISHREMPLLVGEEGEGSATENASIVESKGEAGGMLAWQGGRSFPPHFAPLLAPFRIAKCPSWRVRKGREAPLKMRASSNLG